MKKGVIYLLLAALILVAAKFIFFPGKETTNAAGGGQGKNKSAAMVNGYVVQGENLEEQLAATGTLLANEEAELRPEISGKIIKLNISEGSKVTKGMLLVKINDADLQATLSKLQSQLQLNETKSERLKQLLALNGISKEEFEELQNTIAANKADLQYVKAQIEKTEIRAPFDGIVGLRSVSEGSYVTTDKVIASLQQIHPLKVEFSLPEKYSSRLKPGAHISFTTDGDPEKYTATVYATEPKVDATTRTVKIRARCANPSAKLLPGAFAKIQMVMSTSGNAIMVPTQAVIPVLKGKKVFVSENGVAISRMITTGVRTETQVEVVDGLAAGDTVIVTGIMSLRDSMAVKIKTTSPTR